MKKWIIFISVFVLSLALCIGLFVIWKAGQPFNNEKEKAEQLAITENLLKEVNGSVVYSGSSTFITVSGVDQDGEAKAVFIPAGKKKQAIEEVKLNEGISKKQAIDIVQKEFDVKDVLHAKLGLEGKRPVWEVAFLNDNDKLNYVYLVFENGKWWKRILNM